MEAPASSGGEQIDDFLDRCIGTMIGRLELAIVSALSVGWWWKRLLARGPHRRL
jgi:hypothetical protein